jgi:type II secretory pathway pseudopilin PulG
VPDAQKIRPRLRKGVKVSMSETPNNEPDKDAPETSGDEPKAAEAGGQADELMVPAGEVSQQEAVTLIREAAGQLKDFLADRRRESEELARRMGRIEEEIQQNGGAGRHLTALSVVVAIIAFLATTGLWRLARSQSEVETALKQTMTEVKASRDASLEQIGAVEGVVADSIAKQAEAALRLEKQLSEVESAGKRSAESLSGLREQVTSASEGVAKVRRDVTERLQQQSELTKSERARMVGEIKTAIGGLEKSMEARSQDLAKHSEELKSQQKEFSEATAKAKAERQAMIRAATETVNAQLLSLRTMLDTLEEEPVGTADTGATAATAKPTSPPGKPAASKPPQAKADLVETADAKAESKPKDSSPTGKKPVDTSAAKAKPAEAGEPRQKGDGQKEQTKASGKENVAKEQTLKQQSATETKPAQPKAEKGKGGGKAEPVAEKQSQADKKAAAEPPAKPKQKPSRAATDEAVESKKNAAEATPPKKTATNKPAVEPAAESANPS